ncbi:TOMM precursor leader peptide-binding protein [Actinokineospora sp.]|uniref:TOMM precursor leader peptide-binding protein n=1 Tax=Actinokineospora sp. TaxID=1872133 RepID=UPI00403792F5
MSTDGAKGPLVGLKRHLRAEVATGEGAYLFSEQGMTVLKGSHVESVVSLLDGTRDVAAILGAVPAGVTREQAASVLASLATAGLVTLRTTCEQAADECTLAYWEAAELDSSAAVASTANATVNLVTVGAVERGPAAKALRAAGLAVTGESDCAGAHTACADLTIVLCDDYLEPRLAEIDAEHRAAGRPWLLAKPHGTKVWLGPVFQPAVAGCWHCLATRLWGHRNAEKCAQTALGHDGPAHSPAASVPPVAGAAWHLVALEATKWLAGYRYPGQRTVWTFDTFDFGGRHHELPVYPQCPACGDPELVRARTREPIILVSRDKVDGGGGGHRTITPEQMRDRFRHLVSPVTGVVKEIRRDERGPVFLNAFRSGTNVAARTTNLGTLRAAMRVSNGGKGVTAVQAEVSALCEAVERHSGNFHGEEERVRGSLKSLGEQAIHPNACQLYDERQYADRARWNATHSPFAYVCAEFDERVEVDWTPVWSLTERRHRLLPTGLLYYGAPAEPGPDYVHADSNGSAAGSSLEDAVLQGLLEVVERDAVALWWYNRTRQPAVDLDAFGDQWIEQMRQVYADLGREVWVLDLTADLGIPSMVALSRRIDKPTEDVMLGFGAHLDPRVALRRALTELNQLMPVLVGVGPDGEYACDDPDAVRWWRHATVANQPYLLPDPAARPRVPADYGYTPTADLLDDVTTVCGRVADLGMQVLVLDQTRPDVGLPVVKVLVPGMRHFWTRFAPGRLFDVPVRLGRLAEATPYAELNPVPMFL